MKPTKHNKLIRKIGLTTALTALTTVGIVGVSSTQASAKIKQNSNWLTYYSELAKGGYADKSGKDLNFNRKLEPYFVPQFTKNTKFSVKNGHKVPRSDYDTNSYNNFDGNKFKWYYAKYNPIAKYTNVGKFEGKQVDMTIKIGAAGEKVKSDDMTGSQYSNAKKKIAYSSNMLGVMPMKGPKTVEYSKADYNNKVYKVNWVSRNASGTKLTISFYYHKSGKKVVFDDEHTVGLGYMEMEPAWFYSGSKRFSNLRFSFAQRVVTYTSPVAVGNYNGKSGKSSSLAINDAKMGVLRVRQGTVFPSKNVNQTNNLNGALPTSSAMAEYKKNDIYISWRGHGPYDDLLDFNSKPYKGTKPKPQPAPKKYVGPQSSKPSTYKATSSALADYTKTFSWKIVQKTKKAKFSGKGYTITDTLPSGTSISSVTSPSGWSKSVSGNKVTFKATKNVYKTTHTYNFYVASSTTKSQAMRHTSFNNHVTSRRKITKTKWQTKNSNTAKWKLKNEEIKGYFIDFDHHDHAVAKGYDIFTPKQIYNSGVTSGQKTITPAAEVVAPDNGKLYKLVHGPKDGTYATPSEMKWTSARIKIVNHYKTATRTVGYTKKGKPITESYQYLAYQTFPNGDDKQIHYWYYRTKWYHQVGHAKQGTDPNPYTDSTDPDGDLIKADGNKGEFYQINNSSGSTRKLCLTWVWGIHSALLRFNDPSIPTIQPVPLSPTP